MEDGKVPQEVCMMDGESEIIYGNAFAKDANPLPQLLESAMERPVVAHADSTNGILGNHVSDVTVGHSEAEESDSNISLNLPKNRRDRVQPVDDSYFTNAEHRTQGLSYVEAQRNAAGVSYINNPPPMLGQWIMEYEDALSPIDPSLDDIAVAIDGQPRGPLSPAHYFQFIRILMNKYNELKSYSVANLRSIMHLDWIAGNPEDPAKNDPPVPIDPDILPPSDSSPGREKIANVFDRGILAAGDEHPSKGWSKTLFYGDWLHYASGPHRKGGERDYFVEIQIKRISGDSRDLLLACGIHPRHVWASLKPESDLAHQLLEPPAASTMFNQRLSCPLVQPPHLPANLPHAEIHADIRPLPEIPPPPGFNGAPHGPRRQNKTVTIISERKSSIISVAEDEGNGGANDSATESSNFTNKYSRIQAKVRQALGGFHEGKGGKKNKQVVDSQVVIEQTRDRETLEPQSHEGPQPMDFDKTESIQSSHCMPGSYPGSPTTACFLYHNPFKAKSVGDSSNISGNTTEEDPSVQEVRSSGPDASSENTEDSQSISSEDGMKASITLSNPHQSHGEMLGGDVKKQCKQTELSELEHKERIHNSFVYAVRVVAFRVQGTSNTFTGPTIGQRDGIVLGSGGWVVPPISERLEKLTDEARATAEEHRNEEPLKVQNSRAMPLRLQHSWLTDGKDGKLSLAPVWDLVGDPTLEDVYWMVWRLCLGTKYVGFQRGVGFGEDSLVALPITAADCPFQSPSPEALAHAACP